MAEMAGMDNIRSLDLDHEQALWERFFTVAPLVVVGTRDDDGGDDLAPKHLAMPLSWQRLFGFVCSSSHRTYQNIARVGEFAVTFPRPSGVVLASLAATPRENDGSKPVTGALATFPAERVQGAFLQDGYVFLECVLERIIDDLDDNALIIGRVVGAHVAQEALRGADVDDQDLIRNAPLLAFLYPGRFAELGETLAMPLPAGFKR